MPAAGILKGLMSGLLGTSEFTAEHLSRRAGQGIRRAVAPAGAAGGAAYLVKNKDKEHAAKVEVPKEEGQAKTAFFEGFEKYASRSYKKLLGAVGRSAGIGGVAGGITGALRAGEGERSKGALRGAAGGALAGAAAGAVSGSLDPDAKRNSFYTKGITALIGTQGGVLATPKKQEKQASLLEGFEKAAGIR